MLLFLNFFLFGLDLWALIFAGVFMQGFFLLLIDETSNGRTESPSHFLALVIVLSHGLIHYPTFNLYSNRLNRILIREFEWWSEYLRFYHYFIINLLFVYSFYIHNLLELSGSFIESHATISSEKRGSCFLCTSQPGSQPRSSHFCFLPFGELSSIGFITSRHCQCP